MSSINALSGWPIDLLNPHPDSIRIEDIAAGLSKICRFSGQIEHFYSVAQHSVLVASLLPAHLKLQGLLHDATEAYLGDVTSPLKKLLKDYKPIENNFHKVIAGKFGLPIELDHEVHAADMMALAIEVPALVSPTTYRFECIDDLVPPAELVRNLRPLSHVEARELFLSTYYALINEQTHQKKVAPRL